MMMWRKFLVQHTVGGGGVQNITVQLLHYISNHRLLGVYFVFFLLVSVFLP